MLLAGTPVTVDRDGNALPVERIKVGQTLWNPLTGAEVEVVQVLIRTLSGATSDWPMGLRPHLLPAHALTKGQPEYPLPVLPALRCLGQIKGPSSLPALDTRALSDLDLPLVPLLAPQPAQVVLLLTANPTLVRVAGLLVYLDRQPAHLASDAVFG